MTTRALGEAELKRLACQIYTQLPDDAECSLAVLAMVRRIMFCHMDGPNCEVSRPVLRFDRNQGAGEVSAGDQADQNDRPHRANPE